MLVKCVVFYCLKRSQRCFSVSSVVTFPTHRDGQGLLREEQNALNGNTPLEHKHDQVQVPRDLRPSKDRVYFTATFNQ